MSGKSCSSRRVTSNNNCFDVVHSTQSSSVNALPAVRGDLLTLYSKERDNGVAAISTGEGGSDDLDTALLCFLEMGETSLDELEQSSKEEFMLAALP